MAVKAPYGPTTVFNRSSTFGSGPESPWPKSAMNQGKANVGHGSMYVDYPMLLHAILSNFGQIFFQSLIDLPISRQRAAR